MKSKINYRTIVIHASAWIGMLVVTLLIMGAFKPDLTGAEYGTFMLAHAPIWGGYFLFFYFNRYLLVPKIMMKGRYFLYSFIILMCISAISAGTTSYNLSQYRNKIGKELVNEKIRDDITESKREKNISRIEYRMSVTNSTKLYNPFHSFNISATYGLLLSIVVGIAMAFVERLKRREEVVEEIKRQKVESELAYLKQQINPHFLFNILNSIYSLVLPHSEQASDVVVKLSSILRYMLYETDRDKVSLDKELSILSDFIELHKLRCTDTSNIVHHFDGNFSGLSIEPLIYIPFIENAFKYGTNNVDKADIYISVEYKNNLLKFSIRNKILIKKKRDEHSGIGISNISRRLDIIYGNNYTMEIKNKDDYFEVVIITPTLTDKN